LSQEWRCAGDMMVMVREPGVMLGEAVSSAASGAAAAPACSGAEAGAATLSVPEVDVAAGAAVAASEAAGPAPTELPLD
jgi:hypothetical protein